MLYVLDVLYGMRYWTWSDEMPAMTSRFVVRSRKKIALVGRRGSQEDGLDIATNHDAIRLGIVRCVIRVTFNTRHFWRLMQKQLRTICCMFWTCSMECATERGATKCQR
ncbi:unnamed protein product [Strongylus vulgaris]|uniref:Uncharacterized protein n=1 Tax=Strongylus vulgaris TaxID=40348 RepID=A0A3P7J466_STRVU|nr:unnamed protein product [Strongylus vulgaris]